mmetsp:Transcript_97195/g.258296  ORF Transcript_97195/g.258296 Transcript_97195/m.258296 type:complete len:250 (-) Transcript_97195:298-1047(-)
MAQAFVAPSSLARGNTHSRQARFPRRPSGPPLRAALWVALPVAFQGRLVHKLAAFPVRALPALVLQARAAERLRSDLGLGFAVLFVHCAACPAPDDDRDPPALVLQLLGQRINAMLPVDVDGPPKGEGHPVGLREVAAHPAVHVPKHELARPPQRNAVMFCLPALRWLNWAVSWWSGFQSAPSTYQLNLAYIELASMPKYVSMRLKISRYAGELSGPALETRWQPSFHARHLASLAPRACASRTSSTSL